MSAGQAQTHSHDSALPAFQRQQYALCAALRAPDVYPPPDAMEARRFAIYRELLFNNIESFLHKGFPVLRTLLRDEQWLALVRDFYQRHVSQTPLFAEIAGEFVAYLAGEKPVELAPVWPFSAELAHYEWMELVVMIAEGDWPAPVSEHTEPRWALSPFALVLAYDYPVQRISAQHLPAQPEPTTLCVWRNRAHAVQFMQLTGLAYPVLQVLGERALTQTELMAVLAKQVGAGGFSANADCAGQLAALLADWRQQDILVLA